MKAIIPCAGYGTRMNMKPTESKELTLYKGLPLIEYSLHACKREGIHPHVITRAEKTDLIAYCKKQNVACQVIAPQKEWPETVLASKKYWDNDNILILPDTIFEPLSVVSDIVFALKMGSRYAIGVHRVSDVSKWGRVTNSEIAEKPQDESPGMAWGMIGFKREHGDYLFSEIAATGKVNLINTSYVRIKKFKDVTRGEWNSNPAI